MVEKITLGLDISSVSTGWSILKDGLLVDYGLIVFKSKQCHGERLTKFEAELQRILKKHNPTDIMIEQIFSGPSVSVFKTLSLFHGIAYKVCYQYYEQDPPLITVGAARSIIGELTGLPIKDKEQVFSVIKHSFKQLNSTIFKKDNDITDSIALAVASLFKQGVKIPLTFDKEEQKRLEENYESVRSIRAQKRSDKRRGEESISKTRLREPPRSKPKRQKSRGKV